MSAPGPSSRVVNLPNLLSSSRFVLAAGFLLADGAAVRLGLLGLASFTDFFDGWLARRQRLTSRLGAILDPIADRVFVIAVVVAFLASGDLRPWQAGALLVRDLMTIVGWVVARSAPALRAIPFRARWSGKVLTVVQLVTFLAVLVRPATVTPLVVLAAVLGVVATVDYTLMLWRERRVEA
jgi:CDP-diacylglycerol--glycerol-3-phosphate 3-phosphatidyltransferase